jgi:hypothetical protein
LKGSGHNLIEVLSGLLPWGTEENLEILSQFLSSVPAGKCRASTSIRPYRFLSNPFQFIIDPTIQLCSLDTGMAFKWPIKKPGPSEQGYRRANLLSLLSSKGEANKNRYTKL